MEISHRQDILEIFLNNKDLVHSKIKESSNLLSDLNTSITSIMTIMVNITRPITVPN